MYNIITLKNYATSNFYGGVFTQFVLTINKQGDSKCKSCR